MFEPNLRSVWLQRRQQSARERNIPSAILCLLFIIIVASALAQPRWFYLKGGSCTRKFLGVQEFFFMGHFSSISILKDKGMNDCVTPDIITVHRSIIVLCFVAIFIAMIQFFMDLIGVRHKWIRPLRRNGIGSITGTILMVIIIGLCFYATELMKIQQEKNKLIATISVQIDFGISYYLIIGAGIVGIISAGTNLLRRYPNQHASDGEILLDDCHGEAFSVALPHSHTWSSYRYPGLTDLPPPPPYTP